MIVTEEEAQKKVCFLTIPDNSNYRCIASRCMAWRVRARLEYVDPTKPFSSAVKSVSDSGYCGLAGRLSA